MSSLDQAAKKVLQPKSKKERAIEIGTGVAITGLGLAGVVYSGNKLTKFSPRQKISTRQNDGGGYDVEVRDDANPEANTAKAIASAMGIIASTALTSFGVLRTTEAIIEDSKWVYEEVKADDKKVG